MRRGDEHWKDPNLCDGREVCRSWWREGWSPVQWDQVSEGSPKGKRWTNLRRALHSGSSTLPGHLRTTGGYRGVVWKVKKPSREIEKPRNEMLWVRGNEYHNQGKGRWGEKQRLRRPCQLQPTRLGDQSGLGRGGRTEGCFQLSTLKNWGDGESYWQFQNFHTEGLRQAISP